MKAGHGDQPSGPGVGPVMNHTSGLRGAILARVLQLVGAQVFFGLVLFLSAGTWRWSRAWFYLGLVVCLLACNAAWVLPRNPEIIAERGRRHRGTSRFDKVILPIYSAAGLATFAVSGLDVRFGSTMLPPAWAAIGAALVAGGMIPVAGAMAVNRHLEQTARIQHDRGHQVTTAGPYTYVRHPMYAGLVLQSLGAPLVLGSAWALLPAAATIALIVIRTAFEDRMLRAQLPGYADYAARTRYRLLPGVW